MDISNQINENLDKSSLVDGGVQVKCVTNKKCSFSIDSILSRTDDQKSKSDDELNSVYSTEDNSFVNVESFCEQFVDKSVKEVFENHTTSDRTTSETSFLVETNADIDVSISEDGMCLLLYYIKIFNYLLLLKLHETVILILYSNFKKCVETIIIYLPIFLLDGYI